MKPPVGEFTQEVGLGASVQVLPLPAGLFLFTVKSATATAEAATGNLSLPAMHVGLGPGVRADDVEFIAGPGTEGSWLFAQGDVLVAKVKGAGATLVLTSVRASSGAVLSIEVERLESRLQDMAAAKAESGEALVASATAQAGDPAAVPLRITTHIRTRGDMNFVGTPWAGRVAPGLWIESFAVQPMAQVAAKDLEYKGLTGTGFETPWTSGDANCGTKGMSVPLMGFAIRLRPCAETQAFDCEYSGYFQSGASVGPLRNGAPCRSTVANDPLEGIQIRITRRVKANVAKSAKSPSPPAVNGQRSAEQSPSFGRYRDADKANGNGSAKRTPEATKGGKSTRGSRAPARPQNRIS